MLFPCILNITSVLGIAVLLKVHVPFQVVGTVPLRSYTGLYPVGHLLVLTLLGGLISSSQTSNNFGNGSKKVLYFQKARVIPRLEHTMK